MSGKNKWKKFQKGDRKGHKIGWAVWALTILFALVVVGKFISLVGSLDDPYRPDGQVLNKGYSWDGKSTLNVAVKSDQLYLLTLNPSDSSLTILKIPEETYLNLPFEYGFWPARSIYDLGQAERLGATLLRTSLQFAFGVPIDGYVIFEGKLTEKSLSTVVDQIRTNLFGGLSLLGSSKTDLSLGEYWKLVWGIKGVRFDKIQEVDLGESQISKQRLLPDGSKVLDLDQSKLDLFIQKNFQDQKINQEGATIGIFNSTSLPGLAEKAARLVSNMGGRVILTANFDTLQSQTIVLGGGSYTKERLAEIFAPICLEKKKDQCKLETEDKIFQRAEINIVLGQDFASNFLKKQ